MNGPRSRSKTVHVFVHVVDGTIKSIFPILKACSMIYVLVQFSGSLRMFWGCMKDVGWLKMCCSEIELDTQGNRTVPLPVLVNTSTQSQTQHCDARLPMTIGEDSFSKTWRVGKSTYTMRLEHTKYLGPKDTKSLEAGVVVATYEAMDTQEWDAWDQGTPVQRRVLMLEPHAATCKLASFLQAKWKRSIQCRAQKTPATGITWAFSMTTKEK